MSFQVLSPGSLIRNGAVVWSHGDGSPLSGLPLRILLSTHIRKSLSDLETAIRIPSGMLNNYRVNSNQELT